ncbi:MAG: DUF494 family protein [Candidatus Electryoneaceae bacterium]|nr:DUF494 family protein [Candidatus Electryoneaceae bacterium]
MDHHIVEILVILMREFPDGASPEEFEPLAKDLIDKGYTHYEVETALIWFYNRREIHAVSPPIDGEFNSQSFRILHEIERSIITPAAYGYMIELHQLGIIAMSEMNAVIERAILFGGERLNVDDVKLLVAAQIMEHDGNIPVFEQSFFVNNPTDTIQ